MFHNLIATRNQEIIKLFEMGLSKTFIASQYQMKVAQVSFIIRRGR